MRVASLCSCQGRTVAWCWQRKGSRLPTGSQRPCLALAQLLLPPASRPAPTRTAQHPRLRFLALASPCLVPVWNDLFHLVHQAADSKLYPVQIKKCSSESCRQLGLPTVDVRNLSREPVGVAHGGERKRGVLFCWWLAWALALPWHCF